VYAYQYSRAVKATRAATRNTKVGHIDGYYKIFEETDSEQSTEVSKSSESVQEQPGATKRKQEKPPPLPPQVQQQKQTTADKAAACSSNRRQQVQARKRNDDKAKGKGKRAKKAWEKHGIDWVSWKDENVWQSSMDGLVQVTIPNGSRVWDAERTGREGGGGPARVAKFRDRSTQQLGSAADSTPVVL
jgi:type IV secretory pathway VirB10-like protein